MWWSGLKCIVISPCPGQPEQQGLWPGPAICGERGGAAQHLPQRGGGSGSSHLYQWRQGTNRTPEEEMNYVRIYQFWYIIVTKNALSSNNH